MADMIARLGLNAEAFSAGVKKATSGLGPALEQAGRDASDRFDKALAPGLASAERKIRKTLESAMTVTPAGGALTLDVEGLRAGALAAEQKAMAARELVAAMETAARASGTLTAAQKVELTAVNSVAQSYEEKARAARQEVTALEQVQAALQSKGAAEATAATTSGTLANETGRLRIATVGAGQQLQDMMIQLQGGTRASTIMAQQLPQLAFALSGLEGSSNKALSKVGALGTFLSGPWGLIVPAAAIILGPLIDNLFSTGDAAEKAKGKVDALTEAIDRLNNTKARPQLQDIVDTKGALELNTRLVTAQEAKVAELERKLNARELVDNGRGGKIAATVPLENAKRELARLRAEVSRLESVTGVGTDIRVRNYERLDASKADFKADQKAARDAARAAKKAANDNAREAERVAQAEKSIREELSGTIQGMRDAAAIARIRAEQGDLAADRAQAELEIVRQFPELDGKRAGEWTVLNGVAVQVTQQLVDQLALAKQLKVEEVDRAAAMAEEARFREEEYANGQEVFRRIRKEKEEEQQDAEDRIRDLADLYEDLFSGGAKSIWDMFKQEGKRALAELAAEQTLKLLGKSGLDQAALKTIGKNAGLGSAAASIAGGSGTGGAIGGAIGGALGKELLTKALGSFAGPLGAIAGGLLGGVVGGLFKKAKYGTAVIGATASGELGVTGIRGNSSSRTAAAEKSANALIDGLDSIAEQLGAEIDASRGVVSIGQYKNKWRVSTTGYSGKLNFKGNTGPTGKGLVDFGDDAQAAAEFATLDLIKDGVLVGLRKGTQTLLTNAKELQDGVAKALKFENVFRDLARFKDPIGAAIDDLNREFKSLIETFRQAGATTEETAQLEELYGLRRKELVEQQTSSLRDFLQSLRAGDSSPLSLRAQEQAARAALAPFEQKILAGQAIDSDAFTKAAQTFLSVERQINGSTGAFFDAFNMISALTERAIGTAETNAGGTQTAAQAFAELTAKATQQTATSTQATANMAEQQTQLLQQIRDNLAQLGANPALASFIGNPRLFRFAA